MEDVEVETEVRLRSEDQPKRWQEVELLIRTMVENKPSEGGGGCRVGRRRSLKIFGQ